MIQIRKSAERGYFDHGWLQTYHSFSFADYRDPAHMGFRALRVINEDTVAPGEGFGTHPHQDMEILTYMLSGALAHKDSMGNGRTIQPGELQYMSAGTGVTHSEYNASQDEPAHLLQIWIIPNVKGAKPHYAEWKPPAQLAHDRWHTLASGDGREGGVRIHRDSVLYLAKLRKGSELKAPVAPDRYGWLQVARGEVTLSTGERLTAGDGLSFEGAAAPTLRALTEAELLLFDLD